MKRITLLLLLFLLTGTVAYSQLPQDFEGGIPTSWAVINNGVGTNFWTTVTDPICGEGTTSAFFDGRQNSGAGTVREGWLVSDLVTVPANGQLSFTSRLTSGTADNTLLQVKISAQSQTDLSTFFTLQQWTDIELNTVFNECEEKLLDLTGFAGFDIYIAFVVTVNQPAGITGDRWILDEIKLAERCINPDNVLIEGISQNSATVTWENPGNASLFEVEVVQLPGNPTGVGVEVGPETTYLAENLLPGTEYAVYVRALCTDLNSEWVRSLDFETTTPGNACTAPILISSIPYSVSDNTSFYSGGAIGSPGSSGCGTTGSFLNGNDVYYSFTPDFNGVVNITMTPTGNDTGIFIYNSCANIGVSCIAGVANTNGTPRVIDLPVVSGQTYYILISSDGSPISFPYNLTLQRVNCPPPTGLAAVGGLDSVSLSWNNPTGATSWEYAVQLAGTPIPSGAGVQTNSNTDVVVTETLAGQPITGATIYQFYVRADCGDGTFSAWAGPFQFNTSVCDLEDVCNYTFRLTDDAEDGWDGARMQVRQNGIVVATLGVGFTTGGSVDVQVPLCSGLPFDLFWNIAGSWAGEVGVQIINDSNQTIFEMGPESASLAGTVLYTQSNVVCGEIRCLPPSNLALSSVLSTSGLASWTEIPGVEEYHVLRLPCGSPLPNETTIGWQSVTTTSYQFTDLNPDTCYTFYVRAICPGDDLSSWSPGVNATTQQTPPACGGTFTDPGGSNGNYGNNANVTTTICPENQTDLVTVSFLSFALENNWDFLRVYDGNSAAAPLIGTYTGNNIPPSVTSSSAGGCLTFVFTSDGSGVAAGWVANVTCNLAPSCLRPTALVASSVLSTTALLSWTNNSPSATEWHVLALPCGSPAPTAQSTGWIVADTNTDFLVPDLSPDTCYTFYVRAVCPDDDLSAWSPGVNATTQQAPPVCGGTFTDPGGASGDYANNLNYTVTICPENPEDLVTIDFTSFQTENRWDALYVYNGDSINAPLIDSGLGLGLGPNAALSGGYWSTAGTLIPGPFTSSTPGGCITFRFISDGSGQYDGWVANISCGPPPTCPRPTALVTSSVLSTSTLLSWTNNSPSATEWQVLALPCGSPAPTVESTGWITADTNTDFLVPDLSPDTCYTFYVRAVCPEDDISAWSPGVNSTTQQAPPACGGLFTDQGGVSANYSANSNYTITICPENPGEVLTVVFSSFQTENRWDALYVYDGNSITAPIFDSGLGLGLGPNAALSGGYWSTAGTLIPGPFTSSTVGGCLTFRFISDGSGQYAGWVANVLCETCASPNGLVIDNIGINDITVSWNGLTGLSWEVLAVPCGSPAPTADATGWQASDTTTHTYTGLNPSTCYDFYVRSICEDDDTSGWSLTPVSGTTLPSCPQPIELFATTEIGSYAVNLSWTPLGPETQWEVIVQLLGSTPPTASSTGVIVDTPNYTYMAEDDVFYVFYVRAVCGENDFSFWSGPEQFSIYIPPGCASVDVVGVDVEIIDNAIVVCPDSDIEEINLSASFYGIAATTSYEVESIDYAPPFPFTGGIRMPIDTDDDYTPSFDLPFNFCFFGETYDYCQIGDNGIIAFGRPYYTGDVPQFCEWNLNGLTIPNANFPTKNAIYGIYQDLDVTNNPSANTEINYQVLGTYPCRALVVNFNEVPTFGSDCTNPNNRMTTQIVLYEISNIIEVYVQKRVACTGWPFSGIPGQGVLGIQNAAGTVAYTPPGRNTGAWSAELEAWRFKPNGASDVELEWLMDGEFYSNEEDISVVLTPEQQQELEDNRTLTIQMKAIATYATCTPGEVVETSKTVDLVYLIDFPENDPNDLESCSATSTAIFDLTQNNATILGTYNPESYTINYYLSEEDALVPQNVIEDPTTFEGTNGQQIWVRISDTTDTCFIIKSFFLNFSDDIITPNVEFEYDPAVICISSTSGILSPTLDEDEFNFGGEFTATPEGLVIDLSTGDIDLGASTAGVYEVVYNLEAEGCTDSGTHSFTVELVNADTPIVEFNYDALEYCKVGDNPIFEPAENFDTSGEFTVTPEGLTIDPSTGAIDLSTSATGVYEITYLISSNTGACVINESHRVSLTIIDVVEPTFDPITLTYCIGATPDELPTATNGITGTWSPATIDTSVAVVDAEYIFTPDEGQCSNPVTLLVTVTEEVTPTFDPIVTAYCLNATPDALPTATNGITGSWSPSVIDTSVAVVDAAYVFTPDAGQCAVPVTILVTVSSEITPTFDSVTACQDSEVTLPTTSLEGVSGVWSGTGITPEGMVDTSAGGEFTFTFTPDAVLFECAIAVDFTVTITATVIATFETLQTTYCVGDEVSALPTTSDNGVEGTWDIGTIDTSVASGDEPFVYTFTPNAECNNVTTVSVIVNAPTAPLFEAVPLTYCEDDVVSALPTTSENGIIGEWNVSTVDTSAPAVDVPYTFTPNPGQCASPITLNITVNAKIPSNFNPVNPVCVGEALTLPTTSLEGTVGTWSGAGITPEGVVDTTVDNTALVVTFIPTGCAEEQTVTIQIVARPAVDPGVDQTVCAADGAFPLPPLTNGVYYSGPNGTGDLLVGTIPVSNTPQTVYIFAAGTLAGCSSESSFTVTFVEVEADELTDVEECTRYFLPEIAVGNVYYTGPNQTGTQLLAGQAVEESQTIYVSVGTPSGCYDETSFDVVINNCGIQKGISPNADGLNDFFDLTAFDVRKLSIYNRYGKKVYDRGNYSNEWYGQSNGGEELPDGTYYFVIEFNNIEAKTGWIYINRER